MSLLGKKIGPYMLIEEIGSGGMAKVYKAQQPALERLVAIKELRTELATDDSVILRFRREAKCVAGLAHQNIVHVYDFISRGTSMFIVMEYVEGIDVFTLASRVERIPPSIAAIIALQAARALEYAHFRGVVHRDFKPSNLMITKQGDVKLMDFGIARDDSFSDLTRPGVAIGTPSYMSPEQILGDHVDFRSDIFSFGIVLYQMLTGLKPFAEDDTRAVMQQIVTEIYRKPRSLYPDVPFALQRIVRRCMEKRPERRYHTTEVLRRELETFVSHKVPINYNGRLVIYLRHRGLITDMEAKTYVGEAELHSPRSLITDSGQLDARAVVLRPLLNINVTLLLIGIIWSAVVNWTHLGMHFAHLHIHAAPWAEIYIDGEYRDVTPIAQPLPVAPGRHILEFRNEYFKNIKQTIDIGAAEKKTINVQLTEPRAR